ncbi:MAG: hypothetical protein JNM27_13805 [Leptospirales bacterium]|nr:hypothetical protein [Leptospirales bacterium]
MKTIIQIVERACGYDHLRTEQLTLKNPPFMDLVLDVLYSPERTLLRIGHYGVQNGDLMADPEMIIEILTDEGFNPLSNRNDYIGYYREVDESNDDRANQKLKRELNQFLLSWDRNIAAQGFLDAMSKFKPGEPSGSQSKE